MPRNTALAKAQSLCREHAIRLTGKRARILELLLGSMPQPMSAYELCERYRDEWGEPITAMSVYRMLESLQAAGVVHRLETTSRYLACEHLTCSHQHRPPQFLICDDCNAVRELGLDSTLFEDLEQSSDRAGFQLHGHQLELHGRCANCQASHADS